MITNAPMGTLTQGTIFSCAVAEEYDGHVVHGMVITARCDVTNDKADVYNYVPIVRFADWLNREGVRVLASRVSRTTMGDMKNKLQQLELAPAILNTTAPREILRVIFDDTDVTPKVRNQRASFAKAVERFETAMRCMDPEIEGANSRALLSSERAEAGKLIKELCQNQIAEAYYLPCVEPEELCDGYVVLLREIRHIPRRLALAIANGLDAESFKVLCAADMRIAGRVSIPIDGFSWPIGLVQSPFIEHLMQRLTLLFSRIGVTDVSDEIVKRLQTVITAVDDNSQGRLI